jgi:hypothetical protein
MSTWQLVVVLILTLIPNVILWVWLGRMYYDAGYPGLHVTYSRTERSVLPANVTFKWFRFALAMLVVWDLAALVMINFGRAHHNGAYWGFFVPMSAYLLSVIAFHIGGLDWHNRGVAKDSSVALTT